jgi:hypothetical protein
MVIALAAAAIIVLGSTLSASARGGGGGHGGGGGGHGGGMGGGGMGGGGIGGHGFGGGMSHVTMGHTALGRPGGFARPMGLRGTRVVVVNGRHRFFRHRFAFIGAGVPYGYSYYDDCYVRVWTPWGFRWRYACYY